MLLSEIINSKDNNFNLIRVVAASAVLLGHSFPLVLGPEAVEPLGNLVGMTVGSIAVDVFFITSGLLVTKSLLSRNSITDFAISRCLRILPALFVVLTASVFILGPMFTRLPLMVYFSEKNTYLYFVRCLTLYFDVLYSLPGVFENNAYKYAVNGSLWTMPYEVYMYTILAFGWVLLSPLSGKREKVAQFLLC